jgi:methylase of polypeptide subunit release factors
MSMIHERVVIDSTLDHEFYTMITPDSLPVASAGPFRSESVCDFFAFGNALREAGYNSGAMRSVLDGITTHTRLDTAVLEYRTEEPTPFNSLFRLFLLGNSVPCTLVEEALGGFPAESLVAGGVIREEADGFHATARIDLWEDRYVFADFYRGGVAQPEHVLGTAEASSCLYKLTVGRAAKSALDVGTGGGCQTLMLATHSEKVTGTDVSLRALNFADANARLNGVYNLNLLRGSFFEPVEGEKFDLVVGNPPFIISPESRFIFRDSGLRGDAVSQRVLEEAAAHLSDGGFATILVNWHHTDAQDWAVRPEDWVRDNGCDVLWLRCDSHDPVNYALMWMRNSHQAESRDAREALERWLRYYESLGAGMISFGAVIMRKRANVKNWKRFDFLDRAMALGMASDQIQRIFESEDLLRSLTDENSLLDRKFRVASAHVVEQRFFLENGAWRHAPLRLRLSEGIEYTAAIDEHVMNLLAGLERSQTLREVSENLAVGMRTDTMSVVPVSFAITRALLQKGLLALR